MGRGRRDARGRRGRTCATTPTARTSARTSRAARSSRTCSTSRSSRRCSRRPTWRRSPTCDTATFGETAFPDGDYPMPAAGHLGERGRHLGLDVIPREQPAQPHEHQPVARDRLDHTLGPRTRGSASCRRAAPPSPGSRPRAAGPRVSTLNARGPSSSGSGSSAPHAASSSWAAARETVARPAPGARFTRTRCRCRSSPRTPSISADRVERRRRPLGRAYDDRAVRERLGDVDPEDRRVQRSLDRPGGGSAGHAVTIRVGSRRAGAAPRRRSSCSARAPYAPRSRPAARGAVR